MTETFAQVFELLLKIQRSKSKNTFAQAEAIVSKHLAPWFEKNCALLSVFETSYEETWSDYIAHSKREAQISGHKPRMLGHDRRFLVQALKRAKIKNWIKKVFTKRDFPLLEFSEPIGKHIVDEDIQNLLNYLYEHSEKTYLQVLMAFTMGMRISEILHLQKIEINLPEKEINLDPKRLKTRRARKVPIPITNAVFDFLEERHETATGEFIFPSVKRGKENPGQPQQDNSYWWRKAREAANVKCRFHDLRHTCLSNALANGMPPLTASKIFGCTQQVLERVYDHIRIKDRELHRSILDGVSPSGKKVG